MTRKAGRSSPEKAEREARSERVFLATYLQPYWACKNPSIPFSGPDAWPSAIGWISSRTSTASARFFRPHRVATRSREILISTRLPLEGHDAPSYRKEAFVKQGCLMFGSHRCASLFGHSLFAFTQAPLNSASTDSACKVVAWCFVDPTLFKRPLSLWTFSARLHEADDMVTFSRSAEAYPETTYLPVAAAGERHTWMSQIQALRLLVPGSFAGRVFTAKGQPRPTISSTASLADAGLYSDDLQPTLP